MTKNVRSPTAGKRGPDDAAKAEAWARYYIGEAMGNQTKAAIMAGYAKCSARTVGHFMRRHPVAIKIIDEHRAWVSEHLKMTPERIAERLAAIATTTIADVGEVLEDGNYRIDMTLAQPHNLAAVSEIGSKETSGPDGSVIRETKLKLYNARDALRDLGVIHGMFRDGPADIQEVRLVIVRPDKETKRGK